MQATSENARHHVAAILRAARLRKGWTQARLHIKSGINLGDISRIETARLIPSREQMTKLARALGCVADVLEADTPEPVEAPPLVAEPR